MRLPLTAATLACAPASPVALTAIPAGRIEREAMLNLDRIATGVPNLTLSRNFGTGSGALVFLAASARAIRSSPTIRRSASTSTTCCCRDRPDRSST